MAPKAAVPGTGSVYTTLARRLEEQAPDGARLSAALRRRTRAGHRKTAARARIPNVWARLARHVDPVLEKPRLAPDIEVKEFKLRWGNDYAMIGNPRDLIHYRLTPAELELVKMMDGSRTVKQIVVDRLRKSGGMDLSGVADLVYELQVGNFLDRPFVNTPAAVRRALSPPPRLIRKLAHFTRTLMIEWNGADRFVRWIYNRGLRRFYTRVALAIMIAIAVAGFVAFRVVQREGTFTLTGQRLALEALILLVLNFFITFMHELGHAATLLHFGRRIKSAGFMIYFGSPAFFVDSSDGLMMDRRQRMAQAFAGPFTETVIAGMASIFIWAFPGALISSTLFKFAVLNYFLVFLNLIPMLELDGYWIMSDFIQVPDLRPRSLAFIRHDLWHKLHKREHLTRQEVGLGAYGFAGVAFTVFALASAFYFWRELFGSAIERLWNAGGLNRLLLVLLIAFIGGPLLRALINLARWLARQGRVLYRDIRFRLERGWRVEAAQLIDRLPMFDDVPEEGLSELAGRVRLRTIHSGRPVVRQGERATAFYVVRSGTLQIVEEDSEGNDHALRTLGRGEAFGELGLVRGTPRAVTVRALEESQVFEINKGAFEQLLAEMVHSPTFAPTLQSVAELAEIPCFAHLENDERAELFRYGEWITIPPGRIVMRKGRAGDSFYAIRSGRVEVKEGGKQIAVLGPGEYFGEVALLMDVPRTATVRSVTPVRAFRVSREGFDKVLRRAFRKGTLNPRAPIDRTWHH
jgi:putative peptide zinc metalloprotease protein